MQGVKNNIEDIWNLIEKTDKCWLWKGRLDKEGYGVWWFNGKNIRPHRLIMEINGLEIKPPKVSRHLCNVRHCVNPKHVIAGTQKENVQDQLRFGTHAGLKYSDDLVKQIREEYKKTKTSTRKLAEKYKISKSQAHLIVINKTRTTTKEQNE